MNIYFKPVTKENRNEISILKVSKNQKNFIETTKQCLNESDKIKAWKSFGIYNNNTVIGFVMYGFFPSKYAPFGKLWLDRFLIDEKYQNKGYGKKALEEIIKILKNKYKHCNKIYLSVVDKNELAKKMYMKQGFKFNGKEDENGEKIMFLDI